MVGLAAAKPAPATRSQTSKKSHSASMAPPPPPGPALSKRARSSENGAEEEKPRVRRSKSIKPDKLRTSADKELDSGKGKSKDKSTKRGTKGKSKDAVAHEPNGPYRRAMYSAFLNDAFDKRYRGDNSSYNEIIAQFRALLPSSSALPTPQDASTSTQPSTTPLLQLRTWLDALTSVVSKLDQSHEPLVETILAVPWATTEESFVAAYMRFVGALVSARTEWLKVVLDKCVKGFKYRSPYTLNSPAALPHLTRRLIYTRLHSLLRLLLSLVPTLSPSLSPLLALHFPSKREPRAAQICYIDNLLSLTEYCSALAEDVLTLVVERALNIDVEIQGDPEDWEEVEEEMEAQREAELLEKKKQGRIDDLKAAVGDLVDRPMADDPDDSDDSDEDDDDDDSDGGLDLENLSSDDDEPEPINDEDAHKLARKSNAKMTEAAIRKVLENRSKLDGILRVVLDHLAAAHDDNRSSALPTPASSVATPVVRFGELSTATEFPFDFRDTQSANSTPCGSKESTPTPADVPASAEQIERRTTLFRTLLDIFDRTLLRTFKTRNVQFVLFYLCSRDSAASDHFVGVLLGRALFDNDAPSVTRVAAAGYVASFIARAKFVDSLMTRKVVRHLCQYLEGQMDDFARFGGGSRAAGTSAAAGGVELPVFYAVSQAVFYIFCFRWKDLLEEEEDIDDEVGLLGLDAGRKWMMGLETLKKAVGSSFNPLKVCAQPVVAQFASIAHKTGFMYCYAILEGNRRSASYRDPAQQTSSMPPTPGIAPMPPLRTVSTSSLLTTLANNSLSLGSSSSGTTTPNSTNHPLTTPSVAPRQLLVAEEMDSFFPFDPFKLPLSSVYIDEIYREWEGADDDDDDDDESDTATDDDSSTDASSSQASETEDEKSWSMGGLAVPGMHRRGANGMGSPLNEEEEEEVARSFEAMSISFSPDHASFGGRRAFEREQNRRGRVLG
ncbi:rDNA-binding RNA polymerase I transcriptional factor [Sporobolomyces koalae]|uniref:rDNA-binding RNA polymerase I transcriptional factor n=1 Tax=Sporobolomyces koalae TaxID=500713 RepID=UPI00317C7C14